MVLNVAPVVGRHGAVKEACRVGQVVAMVVGEAGVLEGDHAAHRVVAAAGEGDADVALLAKARLEQPLPLLPLLERHRSGVQGSMARIHSAETGCVYIFQLP